LPQPTPTFTPQAGRPHGAFRYRVPRLWFPARGDPDGSALILQLCALGTAGDGVARGARDGRLASHHPAVGISHWSTGGASGPPSVSPFSDSGGLLMRCSCASAGSSSTSYRMIVEAGHVVDVLLREHRDTASAEAFFRRAQERTAGVVSDLPGQRFLERFEALCALGHGHVAGVPDSAERHVLGGPQWPSAPSNVADSKIEDAAPEGTAPGSNSANRLVVARASSGCLRPTVQGREWPRAAAASPGYQ
jgi:hypothetical protein